MLKILFISLSLFLISGCATKSALPQHKKVVEEPKAVADTQPKPVIKKDQKEHAKVIVKKEKTKKTLLKTHKLFQTVAKKDAILLQKGAAKEHCAICGMNLVKFYKTNHAATDMNGTINQYCSLHCLADHLQQGAELQNPQVVDVTSLKFIPVQQAYYVIGSKKSATMSKVSKYAFKSLDDAKRFQKENGGDIVDFYSAWQVAKKDFK